ncbi:peptide ABC transporter ATP-binding protein [Comamonas testosteroni TK102]|jgi:peptide/nickel transport system ATP-binding protein|uniref:Peptide ABC transporter ATP-binding protein n=1 Tax=Comamonas testosteroni TK102 TaxID=1392005 RepID=A0A076PE49_COMTE|nr:MULTISPECIES: ABC transporter ATP-binding protein [Comamonas]AIJ45039.1 peptide ABC transporter ATP-binding protein [Comamonas testosteroni TK102]MPS88222.1 ABC transporter ATP-binding protein [Comamonas sp.]TYK72445.1 ABC transporter ATP-binding protein [Comamonas sp. Z3]
MALLEVSNLSINLQTHRGRAQAVRDVSFTLERGATLGLIGESGCGKSLTALALLGLLPEHAQVDGSIQLDGQELLGLGERQLCALRGNRMAMVFQEPMSALNPVHGIGRQVAEPLRLHLGMSRAQARARATELLERVGIAQAAQRLDDYPHQFSGGQRQRIMIAMALACGPDLLVADEPTTALDVTVQQRILDLLQELVAEHSMALVLISHDLGVIAQNVEQLLVMYGGTVVESGMTEAVFARRAHPYTRGLFAARPQLQAAPAAGHLPTIAGAVPELVDLPAGCPFAGRCPHTRDDCYVQPPPARTLHQPSMAAPASLAFWRQPHVARCLYEQVLTQGAKA